MKTFDNSYFICGESVAFQDKVFFIHEIDNIINGKHPLFQFPEKHYIWLLKNKIINLYRKNEDINSSLNINFNNKVESLAAASSTTNQELINRFIKNDDPDIRAALATNKNLSEHHKLLLSCDLNLKVKLFLANRLDNSKQVLSKLLNEHSHEVRRLALKQKQLINFEKMNLNFYRTKFEDFQHHLMSEEQMLNLCKQYSDIAYFISLRNDLPRSVVTVLLNNNLVRKNIYKSHLLKCSDFKDIVKNINSEDNLRNLIPLAQNQFLLEEEIETLYNLNILTIQFSLLFQNVLSNKLVEKISLNERLWQYVVKTDYCQDGIIYLDLNQKIVDKMVDCGSNEVKLLLSQRYDLTEENILKLSKNIYFNN
jgi:hypothetical protein